MYRFIGSSSLDRLVAELARLAGSTMPADPLQPVSVIVPNRDQSRWISMRLASILGISANIQFRLPSEWFWDEARSLFPDLPAELPSDRRALQWALYRELDGGSVSSLSEQVRGWEARHASRAESIWDFAGTIADLFDQYQVYRPDMITRWSRQDPGALSADEQWQSTLWRAVKSKWNTLESKDLDRDRGELFEILLRTMEGGTAEGETEERPSGGGSGSRSDEPLILFNPGLLPPPFQRLFIARSRYRPVVHFAIQNSVCIPAEDGSLPDPVNPLTVRFGQEQRVIVTSLLNEAKRSGITIEWRLAEGDSNPQSADPAESSGDSGTVEGNGSSVHGFDRQGGGSLLAAIQRSVRDNEPIPGGMKYDRSIEIHSCFSKLREVEVLYDFLLRQFEELKDLAPDEIAVVTPDPDLYRPWVEAVFSAPDPELPRIPVYFPGNRGGGEGLTAAFLNWLKLPDGRLTREGLFAMLDYPAVSGRFGLSRSGRSMLRRWFEENRVVWGLDDRHRKTFGQPEGSRQTWEAAMKRGWLGQWMTALPGQIVDGQLLFPGVAGIDEREVWGRFSRFLRLAGEWQTAVSSDRTPAGWGRLLEQMVKRLFRETPGDEAEYARITEAIESTVRCGEWAMSGRLVAYGLVRSSLEQALEGSSAGVATYAGGVVFHSMVPVRSIPFRVVALLGLTDDRFPRAPLSPSFDLMKKNPREGERERRREDRNLFLESVMAAREVHYCSTIGWSRTDGERLPPSVILDQWIGLLEQCCGTGRESIVSDEPLNGYSPALFADGATGSHSPLYGHLSRLVRSSDYVEGFHDGGGLPLPEQEGSGEIRIERMEAFLKNSVRTFFQNQFDLRYDQIIRDGGDEEFEIDGLENYLLYERIFGWLLGGMDPDRIIELAISSGKLPEGWLTRRTLREFIGLGSEAAALLSRHGIEPGKRSREVSVRVGEARLLGILPSHSINRGLDIHHSTSKDRLLVSYLRHLTECLVAGKECGVQERYVLVWPRGSDEKKRKLYRLRPVPDASQRLERFISLYLERTERPGCLPIESAWEYESAKDKGERAAMQKARDRWSGPWGRPEREDRFTELLLGLDAGLDGELVKRTALELFSPLNDTMEELK